MDPSGIGSPWVLKGSRTLTLFDLKAPKSGQQAFTLGQWDQIPYQCRPAGKPCSDRQHPGTYNARRDNLEGLWKGQFGVSHGLMVATRFYENVEGRDGRNQVLEFKPLDEEPMLISCVWLHGIDPMGNESELLSLAAITDEPEPEPEVAAAGHNRTTINIKPEHVDA